MAARLGVALTDRSVEGLSPKELRRLFLRSWIPMTDTVLRLIDLHLPSPLEAQVSTSQPTGKTKQKIQSNL